MTRHWTEDDFIARIYGIGREDAHLDECPACREAWRRFELAREAARAAEPREIPADLLMAQRREIHRRMGAAPPAFVKRLVPLLAVSGMLATGIVVFRATNHPALPDTNPPSVESSSDTEFFQDQVAMSQASEPRAAKPIEGLFEEE